MNSGNTVLLWLYTGRLVVYSFTVILVYDTTVLLYYGTVVLRYCGTTVLRYCGTTVLWYYNTAVLWYYGTVQARIQSEATDASALVNIFTRTRIVNILLKYI
jgi:hypothetical protein